MTGERSGDEPLRQIREEQARQADALAGALRSVRMLGRAFVAFAALCVAGAAIAAGLAVRQPAVAVLGLLAAAGLAIFGLGKVDDLGAGGPGRSVVTAGASAEPVARRPTRKPRALPARAPVGARADGEEPTSELGRQLVRSGRLVAGGQIPASRWGLEVNRLLDQEVARLRAQDPVITDAAIFAEVMPTLLAHGVQFDEDHVRRAIAR